MFRTKKIVGEGKMFGNCRPMMELLKMYWNTASTGGDTRCSGHGLKIKTREMKTLILL